MTKTEGKQKKAVTFNTQMNRVATVGSPWGVHSPHGAVSAGSYPDGSQADPDRGTGTHRSGPNVNLMQSVGAAPAQGTRSADKQGSYPVAANTSVNSSDQRASDRISGLASQPKGPNHAASSGNDPAFSGSGSGSSLAVEAGSKSSGRDGGRKKLSLIHI